MSFTMKWAPLVTIASNLVALSVGCGDDTANTGGAAAGGASAGGGGGGGGDAYAALYACEETTFQGGPLAGPGYDPEAGFIGEPLASYVVSTTQIYVTAEQSTAFLQAAGDVAVQLQSTPGLVAFALGTDEGCGVNRTVGLWESEEAMYAFVTSGAHATVMGQTTSISLTGRVTNWVATPGEIEPMMWDRAREQLDDVEPSPIYE